MVDIGSLFASTLNHMGREVVDQVFNSHPWFAWLNNNNRVKPVSDGLHIQEPLAIRQNDTMDWRDYREQIDIREQDPFTFAVWDWKWLNGSVSWFDAQEKMNSGDSEVFDLIEELINNMISSLANALSLGFWANGAGRLPDGMAALMSATNTYGNINRTPAGNAFWRPFVGAGYNTAEALSLFGGADGGIKRIYNRCSGNGGAEPPDFGITTLALYERLEASIDPQRIRSNGKMTDLGFTENIQVDNMVVTWDDNATAGTFSVLNSKYAKLRPHKSNAKKFTRTKPENMYSQGQKGKVILVEWMGNMTCTRPNRVGQLSNKT